MIGGARNCAGILLIASKILPNRPACVDHAIASTITTTALTRPMRTFDASLVSGQRRPTISTATSVPVLLSAAAIVLINAARSDAAINPLKPLGTS